MRQVIVKVCSLVAAVILMLTGLTGCSSGGSDTEQDEYQTSPQLTIGFSQVGAESDWRTANTASMKETFCRENGYYLLFDDAQQKQEKQITALRNFIQQEVDYIILAPVTETGWETVLQEAKEAGIPVIIVDRMVDISDETLYHAWVGSNFLLEGKKACAWLHQYTRLAGIAAGDIHIANIQGTMGASSQIGRTKALEAAAKKYGWDLVAAASGDYARTKSREVMSAMLKAHPEINVVYCENDNEAFGAIEAIQQSGRKVGTDLAAGQVMILSFDATGTALQNVKRGKIALNIECNPLQGPSVRSIIDTLEKGEIPEKRTYIDEAVFAQDNTVSRVKAGGQYYDITVVTKALIDKRNY